MSVFDSARVTPSFAHESQVQDEDDWRDITIVMMQNLPCRCTPEEISAAVGEVGFGPYVNFVHLPRKSAGGRNCGYGFVGFVNAEITLKFRDVFEGCTLKSRTSSKQVRLKPAHRQQASEVNLPHVKVCLEEGVGLVHPSSSVFSQEAPTPQKNIDLVVTELNELQGEVDLAVKALKMESTIPDGYSLRMIRSLFPPPPGLEQQPALPSILGSTAIRYLRL
eukprot:TRINITY_DN8058_c0_g1_i5.p1 TRINITY_DN8058_c0_g1~~TRINITY_DN8058_c0_g1_i5.p1  ORF type:complete len:221 (-),score=46.88 TRINITY_DN8058_c0_g1_i5:431-1093(-)